MGFHSEYIREAQAVVARRRAQAVLDAKKRAGKLMLECPEFASLENELRRLNLDAIKQASLMDEDVLSGLTALKSRHDELYGQRNKLLSKLGLSSEWLDIRRHCQICGDSGYSHGEICACVMQAAKELACEELKIHSPLELSEFGGFSPDYYPDIKDPATGVNPRERMTALLEYCRNYAGNFSPGSPNLLFMGATGLGKTHLSLAIANVALDLGFGVLYGSAQDFLHRIEKEHFGRAAGDTLDSLLSCDLLILDDLGTEFSSQFITSVIYNLVNTRILTRKPTIINTNLGIKELESRYTQRIVSRFVGHYIIKQFFGRDIRILKMQK
ncbi:MAG TPA: ATP-binding protein [Ruminococcaceae bacterium]|nr:ATP-binding protein [Oscillospiraceae bacterium]